MDLCCGRHKLIYSNTFITKTTTPIKYLHIEIVWFPVFPGESTLHRRIAIIKRDFVGYSSVSWPFQLRHHPNNEKQTAVDINDCWATRQMSVGGKVRVTGNKEDISGGNSRRMTGVHWWRVAHQSPSPARECIGTGDECYECNERNLLWRCGRRIDQSKTVVVLLTVNLP